MNEASSLARKAIASALLIPWMLGGERLPSDSASGRSVRVHTITAAPDGVLPCASLLGLVHGRVARGDPPLPCGGS